MAQAMSIEDLHLNILKMHQQKREVSAKPVALIIDDDVWMQRILNNYMQGWGFDTALASDGFEGLELAIQYNPSIIFLDLIMPDLRGDMVLKLFKCLPYTDSIPIIIVSSNIDHKAFGSTFKEGALGFMSKPFKQPVLFRTLEECLSEEVVNKTELRKYSESLKNNHKAKETA